MGRFCHCAPLPRSGESPPQLAGRGSRRGGCRPSIPPTRSYAIRGRMVANGRGPRALRERMFRHPTEASRCPRPLVPPRNMPSRRAHERHLAQDHALAGTARARRTAFLPLARCALASPVEPARTAVDASRLDVRTGGDGVASTLGPRPPKPSASHPAPDPPPCIVRTPTTSGGPRKS